VNKTSLFLLLLILPVSLVLAQEKQEMDSIQKTVEEKGLVIEEATFTKRADLDPLEPSKAAFYSAVLPGLGQVYNKRYWKVPLVYGLMGGSIYVYKWNDNRYKRFRYAYKQRLAGFTENDEFWDLNNDGTGPDLDLEDLQNQQKRFQRDRDLWLLISIGSYIINIVDANVDAHLKQHNVDSELSFDLKPYLEYDELTASPHYGLAMTFKF
jgi:hypothetical protein